MNITSVFLLFLSSAILCAIVYFLFKKFILKMDGPAMKFLGVNIIKDILWVSFWIFTVENSKGSFLWIIAVFLVTSFFLYYKVIRLLNRL